MEKPIEDPENILEKVHEYYGRMNDPTSSAFLQGPCGDSMEFYLVIQKGMITDVKFFSEGCGTTLACGAMAAFLAHGKTVEEALSVSAGGMMKRIRVLPADHLHCSILAVSTLYRAIADYLLQRGQ